MPATPATPNTTSDIAFGVNEVLLVGRLAAPAEARTLPSGDTLWTWRIVVDRPAKRSPKGSGRRQVDTIDCVTYSKVLGRKAAGVAPGELIELSGSLRRRFFKVGNAPASRYEVETARIQRLR